MTSAGLTRFFKRANEQNRELFPAQVKIGGVLFAAVYAGGRAAEETEDGGFVPVAETAFRVSKDLLATPPEIGDIVIRIKPGGEEQRLRVIEVPPRPHETEHYISCRDPDA